MANLVVLNTPPDTAPPAVSATLPLGLRARSDFHRYIACGRLRGSFTPRSYVAVARPIM
ncbi:MAG TPA: hypothetical protein VJV39_27270 [Dongiaceae bacterium]|nr:hypothetical protein [Dongiaceae bacterium]